LTPDLFKIFADTFNITVREVVIYKLTDGIFFAKLICYDGKNVIEIDSRTSDAVAIALRVRCPIYTYESILSAAGIIMDEDSPDSPDSPDTPELEEAEETPVKGKPISSTEYANMTLAELEESLLSAINDEAYERASLIRDEINKRKKGKNR